MITAQGDDTRQRLAAFRRSNLGSTGCRLARKNGVMPLLNLMQSPGVVVAKDKRPGQSSSAL